MERDLREARRRLVDDEAMVGLGGFSPVRVAGLDDGEALREESEFSFVWDPRAWSLSSGDRIIEVWIHECRDAGRPDAFDFALIPAPDGRRPQGGGFRFSRPDIRFA